LFFTGHKIFADSGIWVLWWKYELLNKFRTPMSWGWAIWDVTFESYTDAGLPDKFEFWTPNVTWAVSLLKAFEYIESIGWYNAIETKERELVEYFLEKFNKNQNLKMIWSAVSKNRVWVFSFVVEWFHSHDIAEALAENWVAVRAWKHCAHPLFYKLWQGHSIRVSLHIYNNKEDIDKLFEVLEELKT
jgi:selenocysteine lyase/cysteine desulfurase